MGLFPNHGGVAESAPGGVTRLFGWQAIFLLLFFFQLQIRTQLPFDIRFPLLKLPPFHISSPQQRATSRVAQCWWTVPTDSVEPRIFTRLRCGEDESLP